MRSLEEGVKLPVLSQTNYTRNLKFVIQVQTSMECQKIYHIAAIRWVVLKIFCSVQFASKLKCFETKKEVADDDKMLSVISIIRGVVN